MVMGVPYTQSANPPGGMSVSSPVTGLIQGMQAGMAGREAIDRIRTRRKLDKLFSRLGESKPTQKDFMDLTRYMGPEGARNLLQWHDKQREWSAGDRQRALGKAATTVDMLGTAADRLSDVPPEERMAVFSDMFGPLAQNPEMMPILKPVFDHFKDGDFSDERLDTAKALAYSFGRYQEVQDGKLKAAVDMAKGGGKGGTDESKNWTKAEELAKQYGGNAMSHFWVLEGKNPIESINDEGQTVLTLPNGQPYDTGSSGRTDLDPNDPLLSPYNPGNAAPGSPENFTGGGGTTTTALPSVDQPGGDLNNPGMDAWRDQGGGGTRTAGGNLFGAAAASPAGEEALIEAVIQQESGGDPKAVSPKGARGLMQVMVPTAKDPGFGVENVFEVADRLGVSYPNKSDKAVARLLENPEVNREFGTKYLQALIQEFNGDVATALVAYNWGPSEAKDWDGILDTLPKETRDYVNRIMGTLEG